MRSYFLAIALIATPVLADSEARQGADWVRITANPCADEKVLQHIPPDDRASYRAATAEFGGTAYSVCWRPIFPNQVIHLRYEDGDEGLIPFGSFKPVKSA